MSTEPTSAKRARARPTRPRPQLDEDTILDAARLLAASDTEPLTVRRLGQALGADPTAVYRHFRDKDELVKAIIDRLISESVEGVDPTANWRTRLTSLADLTLEIFVAHPAVGAEAATSTTGGPGEVAAINLIVEAMTEAGLGREDSVRYYAVFSSYVLAMASAQARDRLVGAGSADDAYQDPWIGPSTALRASRLPGLAAVRDELEQLRFRETYQCGVQVVLDAVTARSSTQFQAGEPALTTPTNRRGKTPRTARAR